MNARPNSRGQRPYRIVMLRGNSLMRWSYGFKTRETAQREVDRLNARPDEYRDGWTAEVRGPSPAGGEGTSE